MALWLVTILYESADALPGFLRCLQAQTLGDWRLVAIDNASRDNSAELVKGLADDRVTLLRNGSNLGFGKAANQGFRHVAAAGGDFLVLINNDTQFGPSFLADLLAARQRTGAEVIAPRVMRLEDPATAWYAGGRIIDDWVLGATHFLHDETAADRIVDLASGCCLGISLDTLRRVGLFDESFFVYWEDTDFCLRLRHHGIPIHYVVDPFLLHEGGASSGGERSPVVTRLFNRSHVILLRKHRGLAHALRCCVRMLVKKWRQPHTHPGALRDVVPAMLHGLVSPLKPEPRL
jgi:GT2 family glycosyltransferase